MSYPARCSHNVIRCDKCMEEEAVRQKSESLGKETITKLLANQEKFRKRNEELEAQLKSAGETIFDLKSQLRAAETLNDELRLVRALAGRT